MSGNYYTTSELSKDTIQYNSYLKDYIILDNVRVGATGFTVNSSLEKSCYRIMKWFNGSLDILHDANIRFSRLYVRLGGITMDEDNTYGDFSVNVIALNSKFSLGKNSNSWNLCSNGDIAATISTADVDSSNGLAFYITNESHIKKIIENGISFIETSELYNSVEKHIFYTTRIEFRVWYDTTYVAPVISDLKTENENYSYGDDIKTTWIYTQDNNSPQVYIDVSIKPKNAEDSEYIVIESKKAVSEAEYTIPTGSFPKLMDKNGSYTIQVRAYSEAGTESNYITTDVNVFFPHADELNPSEGAIKLSTDEISLRWKTKAARYNKDSGYSSSDTAEIGRIPTNYDIQYSINSGESWDDIISDSIVNTDDDINLYYTVPANFFSPGIITWRVRPWVNGHTIDNFEKETFIVRVQASTSSVTCDGKPQPTLSWVSSSQVAYQVRFADFDSGAIYGTETSYTIPYYYADGNYPVQVRTQASNGVWSDWTELEYVAITNITAAGEITLTAKASRHAVVVNWETTVNYVNYILYRNNIPIYVGADSTYTDIAANGNAVYTLRGIVSNGYYKQSNTVNVDATPKTDCVYDLKSQSWIPLKLSLSSRSRNYTKSVPTYYKYYAGRTKPVAFTEGNTEHSISVSYAFKTREEAERILNLAGKVVIYKDTNGGIIRGILADPAYQSERVYPVSFTIVEIDYNEEVKYETVSV